MTTIENNRPSPKGLLFPILLLLCIAYIIASGIRGCSRERELTRLQNESLGYDGNLSQLYAEIDSLKIALSDAYEKANVTASGKKTSNGNRAEQPPVLFGSDISDKGTHFEVQIGAFQFFDLHKYRTGFSGSFKEEHDTDELDKYVIAKFRKYAEADAFKRDIIRLGIDDAWIVAKKDGKRVDINTVLKK